MRTDKEILAQTNALANRLYMLYGNKSRENFKFYEAIHPLEKLCWRFACEAQLFLTNTDVEDFII